MRVPLQVLGRTVAKAWQDRILGLSAEAAFWQILSVPPLLIGLLGSLGYLGNLIGARLGHPDRGPAAQRVGHRCSPPTSSTPWSRPTLNDILGSGRLDVVSLGFLLSLWAGSSATATFMNTDRHRLRPARRPRPDPHPAARRCGCSSSAWSSPSSPCRCWCSGRGVLVGLLPVSWQPTATVLVNAVYWPLVLDRAAAGAHQLLPRDAAPPAAVAPAPARARCWRWRSSSWPRWCCAPTSPTSSPRRCPTARWPHRSRVLLFCFFFGMAVLLGAELNATIQARWPAPLRRHERRRRGASGPRSWRSRGSRPRIDAAVRPRCGPAASLRAVGASGVLLLLELLVDLLAGRADRAAGLRASWSPGRPRRTAPRPSCP